MELIVYKKVLRKVLFELILAANYLDIKSLLDLTCAKVASMIKGKNTEAEPSVWSAVLRRFANSSTS